MSDVAIALGLALNQALGLRSNIQRVGDSMAPVEASLARAVVDVSGTAHATVHLDGNNDKFKHHEKQLLDMVIHV